MTTPTEIAILEILRLMSKPNGTSIPEICSELGCTRQSAVRYWNRIEQHGFQFDKKPDFNGKTNSKRIILISKETEMLPVLFNETEQLILKMLLEKTHIFDTSLLKNEMELLRKKLDVSVNKKAIRKTAYYSIIKRKKSYKGKEEILKKLSFCIEHQKQTLAVYKSPKDTEVRTYIIEPYTLVDYDGALYVLVCLPAHAPKIFTYAVERFISVEIQKESFTIPDNYVPEEHFYNSFGLVSGKKMSVKIHVSSAAAIYAAERIWGENQSISYSSDGTCVLSFDSSGFTEILCWVLSFGKEAQVLEPPELVEEVKRQLSEAGGKYS